MKHEILSKLKSAEEETLRRTEFAKNRGSDVVKGANQQAQEILKQAESEARRDQAAEVQKEQAHLEQERTRILNESKTREQKLRQHFQANLEPQLKKAVETFTRTLNA